MRSVSEIERLAREIRIEPGAAVDRRVLASAEEALAKSQRRGSAAPSKILWRAVIRNRITKIAAAAVIIVTALIGMKVLFGLGEPPAAVPVAQPASSDEVKEGSDSPVDIELRQVRAMFAAGDVKGLATMLTEGQFESKILAANLLAEMDNGIEALEALEHVQADYGKDDPGNPFTPAVERIRKNNYLAKGGHSGRGGGSLLQGLPEESVDEAPVSPSVETPNENQASLRDEIWSEPLTGKTEGSSGEVLTDSPGGPQLTEGVSGKAYYFDGESDYINIADSRSLDISGDQITISVWMKTERLDKRQVVVAKTGWGDNSWLIEIYPYGGGEARLTFYLIAGEPDLWSFCSGTRLKADTWYHLVFVYTGEEKRIYMNAVLDSRETVSGNIETNDQPVRIGGWGDPIGPDETRYFEGVIDEVAIFARALSEGEILRLYQEQGSLRGHEAGLVGYWSFNTDRGSAVIDGSRYGNHGELRNEPESYFAVHGWARKPGAEAAPEPEVSYDESGPTLDEGVSGYAYYFDGKGDYINIEESESLDISGDQITISAWIKPERIDRRQVIAAKNAGADDSWIMEINPIDCGEGRLNFFMLGEDTGEGNLCGNSRVIVDTWCHVACVYTGEERIIYVNGQVDSSRAGQGNIHLNDQPVKIGNWGSLDRAFNGTIDEVAIFRRALSDYEILGLYRDSGRLRGNEAGLVGYWNFDRDGEDVVVDSGPYQNHGEFRDEPEPDTGDIYGGRMSAFWSMSPSVEPEPFVTTAPKLTGGVSGYAYYFNGNGDYIQLPKISLDDFSVCFWVSTEQDPVSGSNWYAGNGLVDAEINGVWNDWGTALIDHGKVAFGVGSPDTTIKSQSVVNDGNWHFVTATRNRSSGEMVLYIDGVRESKGTGSRNALDHIKHIGIGNNSCDVTCNRLWFAGVIDEVAIFERVLSDDEISQIYQSLGRLRGYESGLVGYWSFDNDDDDIVRDSSPSGNHGKSGGEVSPSGPDMAM
ncbi:MAG: LamG domain-containing protein [Planctomycetota bacterium]|jgi:hypothetical protein